MSTGWSASWREMPLLPGDSALRSIGHGEKTAADVAEACETDPVATLKLLNTLVGCGYLAHRSGRYRLTSKSRKWLLRDSPHLIADKLRFQYDEWEVVGRYEEYLTTGRPLDMHSSFSGEGVWERYQRAMRALSAGTAEEVAPSPSARYLEAS